MSDDEQSKRLRDTTRPELKPDLSRRAGEAPRGAVPRPPRPVFQPSPAGPATTARSVPIAERPPRPELQSPLQPETTSRRFERAVGTLPAPMPDTILQARDRDGPKPGVPHAKVDLERAPFNRPNRDRDIDR